MTFLKNISQQNKLVAVFLLIVIFHIIFKSFFINYSGFWYDETFGLHYSLQDWGLIKHTSEWDLNPPLYYYFLWIWRNLFGISEFAIRFSSVLFSSLSAGIIYIFSIKYFNKTTALISLLIYTSSNEIFFYSHEARCYSMLFFLTLCSSYFYFNLLNKKSISSIILLGLTNFLLIYTHYLTGLVLVFQGLLILLFFNKTIFKQVSIAFLITLVLAFWRFTKKTILLIFNHEKKFWLSKPTYNDLINTVYDFFNEKEIFFIYVGIIIITLIIIYATNKFKAFKNLFTIKTTYIAFCGVGTIIICYALSSISPVFTKRYVVYALPFICLLIGIIISRINNNKFKYVVTSLICLLSLYSFNKIDFKTPKPMNYRDSMVLIKKEKTPSTLTLVETKDMESLFAYYYDKEIFLDYKNLKTRLNENNIHLISGMQDLQGIDFERYDKLILTQTFVQQKKENEMLLCRLSSIYKKKTLNKDYVGIDIYIFNN